MKALHLVPRLARTCDSASGFLSQRCLFELGLGQCDGAGTSPHPAGYERSWGASVPARFPRCARTAFPLPRCAASGYRTGGPGGSVYGVLRG